VNDWYVGFGAWQTRVFEQPDYAAWPKQLKDELDQFILDKCLSTHEVAALPDEAEAVASARWRFFPRLNPVEANKANPVHDALPDLKLVKKLVLLAPRGVPPASQAEEEVSALKAAALQALMPTPENKPEAKPEAKEAAGGFSALKAMEAAGAGALAEQKALEESSGAEGEEEEEEESLSTPEFDALVAAKEAEEKRVVDLARRDEWWMKRELAREELLAEAAAAKLQASRRAALAFALPGLDLDADLARCELEASLKKSKKKKIKGEDEDGDAAGEAGGEAGGESGTDAGTSKE